MVNQIKGAVLEGVIKSPDLISIPMVEDYLVLACSKDHPFASLTSFCPSVNGLADGGLSQIELLGRQAHFACLGYCNKYFQMTDGHIWRKPQVDTFSFIGNTAMIEDKLLKSELDAGIVEGVIKSPDLISIPMVEDYLVLRDGSRQEPTVTVAPIRKCSVWVQFSI